MAFQHAPPLPRSIAGQTAPFKPLAAGPSHLLRNKKHRAAADVAITGR